MRANRNKNEEEFHDNWARMTNSEEILVERYFTSPTAVECKYILQKAGQIKGKNILDLGCGLGEASVWFALQGANVIALDVSSGMLDCVKKLRKKFKVEKSIILIKSEAEKIPLQNESVDLVFGGNILHHTDIVAVSREVKRVLKFKGKAFFVEPLAYNPLINLYRKLAKDVRSRMERPFTFKDIDTLSHGFSKVEHREFQLFTTLIFVWFFLGEGLNPSKVRYWRKFISDGEKYKNYFSFLSKIDNLVLTIPFLKRYCWNTVIELSK